MTTNASKDLYRLMDEFKTLVEEKTGKVSVGFLVSKPKKIGKMVGILTDEGFDGMTLIYDRGYELTIRQECFEEGEILLETNSEFYVDEKDPKISAFYKNNDNFHDNALLPFPELNERLTQIEGLILLDGYLSYGYLVADNKPDGQTRHLWCLIHSVENDDYNTTGMEGTIYMDVKQYPVSLTQVFMVGDPYPIPLVMRGDWEPDVVYSAIDNLLIDK